MFAISNENKPFFIISLILVLVVGLFLGYVLNRPEPGATTEEVLCAQDVKQCADGSYVSRTGRNCEFAECPASTCAGSTCQNAGEDGDNNEDGWKTQTDQVQGVEFKYPETFPAKYIHGQEWPPKITLEIGNYSCETGSSTSSLPNVTIERVMNGHTYCIESTTEGAAGSAYTTYIYKTQSADQIISTEFTLQYPTCLNYEDPQKTECATERESFNLDALIDQIVSSIKLI